MDAQTILLVDDHEDSRIIYRTILRHHGYRTLEAADRRTAGRIAREHAPDLVILSTFLPDSDNPAPDARALHDAVAADVPLLLMTAHPLDAAQLRALGTICDGYLAKPCPPSRLLAEVRRLLRRPRAT